jgi:hypothetical protein
MIEIHEQFAPPLPDGWNVYRSAVEVAGTFARIGNAVAFAHGTHHSISFEPEPTNPHDAKAIKVIGIATIRGVDTRLHLGYIPKAVVADLPNEYSLRLREIWLGGFHEQVATIRFDVVARSADCDAQSVSPVIRHFSLRFLPPIPQGWMIFSGDEVVESTRNRLDNVIAFASGTDQSIVFETGPETPENRPIVWIIGVATVDSEAKRFPLGVMSSELVARLPEEYLPRLRNVWLGGDRGQACCIRFDVLCRRPSEAERSAARRAVRAQIAMEAAQRKVNLAQSVARPPVLRSLYINDSPNSLASSTYCSKCRKAYTDLECPTCGRDIEQEAADEDCSYCGTNYRSRWQHCPVCSVERMLERASDEAYVGKLGKAISSWNDAYQQAQTHQYRFTYHDFLRYTAILAEAGFSADALEIFRELNDRHFKGENGSISFNDLAAFHEAKFKALSLDKNRAKDPVIKSEIVCAGVLCQLYLHYDVVERLNKDAVVMSPVDSQKIIQKLEAVLKKAKLNMKGRSDELWRAVVEYFDLTPRVSENAVKMNVDRLVNEWCDSQHNA